MSDASESDLREKEGRIRHLKTDAILKAFDSIMRAQDIRYAPITLAVTAIGTGGALFDAAIAFLKWIG
jgi:hypothetical protein